MAAAQNTVFFLLTILAICCGQDSGSASFLDAISVVFDPDFLFPGTTDVESVTCTVQDVSSYGTLMTVLLFKVGPDTSKQDLVNVVFSNPNSANILTPTDANSTASLNQTGESFIKLEWNSPTADVASTYGCQISVFDPSTTEAVAYTKTLTLEYADMNSLVSMIKDLRTELEVVQAEMSFAKDAMFYSSNVTNGGKHHISIYQNMGINKAEAACKMLGGQLAVPKDDDEITDIVDFAESVGMETDDLLLGITDEKTEGVWVSRTTGEAAYLRWYNGYPNTMFSDENDCVMLAVNYRRYFDTPCFRLEKGRHILCQTSELS